LAQAFPLVRNSFSYQSIKEVIVKAA